MRLWRKFLYFARRRQMEADLAEEMRLHREMAGAAFGSEAIALEDSRAVWRFAWIDSLAQDVRFALRSYRKAPGFALTVIATLALGLGTLATSFSVFNALVLRPYAVRDPYSLYHFLGWGKAKGSYQTPSFTWTSFNDFRQRNAAFSEVFGYWSVSSSGDGLQAVTGNYFEMLGARICMGRPIMESDDVPGGAVAVASYSAWKSRLGGDPAAVGKKLRVADHPVELVGVACPEFNGLEKSRVDYWLSLAAVGDVFSATRWIPEVVGRLKPGITPEGAEAALVAYGQQVYPTWRNGERPRAATLEQAATVYPLNASSIKVFLPVFAAFGLILLIACANVSNMMLARGLARQREIGIRISLGAGRTRVFRQLLTEGLLLAVPAAFAAYWISHGVIAAALWLQTDVLHAGRQWSRSLWNQASVTLWKDTPDWRVFAFLVGAAVLATLAFGLVPALQTVRSRLVDSNRGEFAADRRPALLRSLLVVAQVGVCAFLLISAGLALRGEQRLASRDFRVDANGIFTVRSYFFFAGPIGNSGWRARRQTAIARLAELPQTSSVAVVMTAPGTWTFGRVHVEGRSGGIDVRSNRVSPGYFGIFGVPIRGRNFSTEEAESEAPVAIVTEAAARWLWPQRDALGQVIELADVKTSGGRVARVVGVIPDSDFLLDSREPDGQRRGAVYFPSGLTSSSRDSSLNIVVRMRGGAGAGRRAVEEVVKGVAPWARSEDVIAVKDCLDFYLYPYRALVAISGFLGALALLLTVSGVFGVASYAAAQRKKEFGIRLALGAAGPQLVRMALRQSVRLAVAGAAIGALAALWLVRVVGRSIGDIEFFDLSGYAGGVLVVIAAAVGAAWIPARRAVRVDPVVTLRCD